MRRILIGILVAQFRLRLHTHSPANATCHRQNFPRRVAAPRGAKIQAGAGPSRRFGLSGASLPGLPLVPAMTAFRKEIHTQQLAQFLAATGRRLRVVGKVISHFFRKGKLGLKLAIKIPFFVEIEVSFETDWNRRR